MLKVFVHCKRHLPPALAFRGPHLLQHLPGPAFHQVSHILLLLLLSCSSD